MLKVQAFNFLEYMQNSFIALIKKKKSGKESGYNTQVYPPTMSSLHCQQPSLPFQLASLYLKEGERKKNKGVNFHY